MIKNKYFGRMLLLVLVLGAFLVTGGNAAEMKQASKVTKDAKSKSKESQTCFRQV